MRLISSIRKKHKILTTELAHELGVNQSTIVRAEQSEARGTISLNTLRKIAHAMGYDLQYQFVSLEEFGRKGQLGEAMKEDQRERLARLSPEERIELALSLSKLGNELKERGGRGE